MTTSEVLDRAQELVLCCPRDALEHYHNKVTFTWAYNDGIRWADWNRIQDLVAPLRQVYRQMTMTRIFIEQQSREAL